MYSFILEKTNRTLKLSLESRVDLSCFSGRNSYDTNSFDHRLLSQTNGSVTAQPLIVWHQTNHFPSLNFSFFVLKCRYDTYISGLTFSTVHSAIAVKHVPGDFSDQCCFEECCLNMVGMPVGCNPEFFACYLVLFLSEPLGDSSVLCFTTGPCFPPVST